jgi:hypothetical protein
VPSNRINQLASSGLHCGAVSDFCGGSYDGVLLTYIEGFADPNQCLSYAREPARVVDVVEFARERLGLDADEPQQAVLRSKAKRGILNCTRQWGKSTVAGAKAVHRAFTTPKSMVIVASPGGAAERGVDSQGGRDGRAAGYPAAGRRL